MIKTVNDLIVALEASAAPDQGLNYRNSGPKRRYDPDTGDPYETHEPTHLFLYGRRAQDFYDILNNAKHLAVDLRELIKAASKK